MTSEIKSLNEIINYDVSTEEIEKKLQSEELCYQACSCIKRG